MNASNELYERDNYEEAAIGYRRVVSLDSGNGEAFYRLGYSLAMTKESLLEEAQAKGKEMTLEFIDQRDTSALRIINSFLKAAELQYRSDEAYYNAAVYMDIFIKDDSATLELYRKSLDLNPNQPEAIQRIREIKQTEIPSKIRSS